MGGELTFMLGNKWDISSFATIFQTEIENDVDAICDRTKHGEGPFLILGDDGQRMVMMGWEDYWSLFGSLYPPGEREKSKKNARNSENYAKK